MAVLHNLSYSYIPYRMIHQTKSNSLWYLKRKWEGHSFIADFLTYWGLIRSVPHRILFQSRSCRKYATVV